MESNTESKPSAKPTEVPLSLGPPTPLSWRLALTLVALLLTVTAVFGADVLGPRGQSALGVLCFLTVAAIFSTSLQSLNWRTIGWGFALQLLLVLFVLKFEINGVRPGFEFFKAIADVAKQFLAFSDVGAQFVFGKLADPKGGDFIFAFRALPTIIFVSSFFTLLYHFGILQQVVRLLAWVMRYLMGTSGAETLSVTANVVMGQTEAPLMVKPYIERMTTSELLTLMVGGMAHISGALMAVYIGMGADAVAILATSVMASPCSLYMAKILLPETRIPETAGIVKTAPIENPHVNAIDAAASGASDGVRLAINIAGMLIAFLAFIALFDYVLQTICFSLNYYLLPKDYSVPVLTLASIFSFVFAPIAYLLGLNGTDVPKMADLLGLKLVANEFVAFTKFKNFADVGDPMSARGQILATYALTGFANFASIGIQLGGIGALAPTRRADLARLGPRALLAGFLVTLVNAAIAGMFL